jgi:hypothetical protein
MHYVGVDHHRQYSHVTLLDEKGEVAKLSPEESVFPQQAFRLGYAEQEKEHTPRRSLKEVFV